MTSLGFINENSWESEEEEKTALWKRIMKQKEDAWQEALKRADVRRRAGKKQEADLPEPE
jgi:hypothetical protein